MLSTLVLSGQALVLEQSSLLERLAERHGQPAAMNWLNHFLKTSSFRWKKPCLVLILRGEVTPSSWTPDDVYAAVLLFEYRALGLPTGLFSTDDCAGFRTVIAPESERAGIAAMVADALLDRGARAVLVSYGHAKGGMKAVAPETREPIRYAWQTRSVAMTLPLEPTIEATLAKLGKSTRFNLGYYRRRLEADMSCEFVADARGMLSERELETVNASSLNPISVKEFRLQYKSSCELPGGFLLGLRNAQGQWISLIGGWRQAGVTVLQWQMNTAGYERFSIGTVMRSYYLDHEVKRGTRNLVYYGGTRHSLGHSFVREEVTDLIVQRLSLLSAAVQRIVQTVISSQTFLRIDSVLARAIGNQDLDWQESDTQISEPRPEGSEL